MSIFTRKIKPFFKSIFQNLIVEYSEIFNSSSLILEIPNYFSIIGYDDDHLHTQYSQSSEFTHYKSHFGPKIDVSITVIYTKAAREEEEEACVSDAMQFIIGYSSRVNSLSPMKRIPAVINYVKSCVRRTGHKLI